ncbi:MAG: 30S ribosome-binding factor RbfA [Gammaproteobacteria bacterium]|jgi:ribosome-binding factor A|nr:30S ribosome-binding factor RbfA [Gammaproteobacteria bacterium]
MSRDFPRSRRIEDQIQRSLSEIIRTRVRDPRLHGAVITGVDVSRDLSVAWVYFSSLDGQQDRVTLENAFASALGFLRAQLAKQLTVRHVPELRMRYDDTTERSAAMDRLIDEAVAKDADDDGKPE